MSSYLQTRDSADLVEREQELDGFVEMTFDLLREAGSLTQDAVMEACGAFILALEIDCQLAARWGDSGLGIAAPAGWADQ
ncbi:MAG TPA: hypothetical protein VIC82_03625 [Candidatus Nanopelagicales bacterium]